MKTKKRKSRVRKYKNLALLVVGFGLVGALFSYRALGLSASSSISGVSSMSKNSSVSTKQDRMLNIAASNGSNSSKTPTQPSPAPPPTPSPNPKTTIKTTPVKTSSITPPPAPLASNDIAPESACAGEGNVAAAKTVLVCMTSYARNAHGLSAVFANSPLMNAADAKAQDITNCGFSHTACGHPFDYWFGVKGYTGGCRGENIAEGQTTPLEVFTAWMNSSGHRANILNAVYKDEGIAAANSSNGVVWVMELGGC